MDPRRNKNLNYDKKTKNGQEKFFKSSLAA